MCMTHSTNYNLTLFLTQKEYRLHDVQISGLRTDCSPEKEDK